MIFLLQHQLVTRQDRLVCASILHVAKEHYIDILTVLQSDQQKVVRPPQRPPQQKEYEDEPWPGKPDSFTCDDFIMERPLWSAPNKYKHDLSVAVMFGDHCSSADG